MIQIHSYSSRSSSQFGFYNIKESMRTVKLIYKCTQNIIKHVENQQSTYKGYTNRKWSPAKKQNILTGCCLKTRHLDNHD